MDDKELVKKAGNMGRQLAEAKDRKIFDLIVREHIADRGLVNPKAARKLCLAHVTLPGYQEEYGPFECVCPKKCECGVDKTGGRHSSWCPKSNA